MRNNDPSVQSVGCRVAASGRRAGFQVTAHFRCTVIHPGPTVEAGARPAVPDLTGLLFRALRMTSGDGGFALSDPDGLRRAIITWLEEWGPYLVPGVDVALDRVDVEPDDDPDDYDIGEA